VSPPPGGCLGGTPGGGGGLGGCWVVLLFVFYGDVVIGDENGLCKWLLPLRGGGGRDNES
jgi:hypothetical protein